MTLLAVRNSAKIASIPLAVALELRSATVPGSRRLENECEGLVTEASSVSPLKL